MIRNEGVDEFVGLELESKRDTRSVSHFGHKIHGRAMHGVVTSNADELTSVNFGFNTANVTLKAWATNHARSNYNAE